MSVAGRTFSLTGHAGTRACDGDRGVGGRMDVDDDTRTAVAAVSDAGLDAALESHRRELTGFCHRMLGSSFEAEDAVQETLVRAWRGHAGFEGRAGLRSWLYRIATRVCLDLLAAGGRRARPIDLTGPAPLARAVLTTRPDHTWPEPVPDSRVLPATDDPAETAVAKESVRLAFLAALRRLPPRQRAVLILREVLAWRASEVAEFLDTSVASVNSALQRARATLSDRRGERNDDVSTPQDARQRALLDRYVSAFEAYDISALTTLLREDAVMSTRPFALSPAGPGATTGFLTSSSAHRRGVPAVAR